MPAEASAQAPAAEQPDSGKAITREQALAALDADRQARVLACELEVQAALDRHRCALRWRQLWLDGSPQPGQHYLEARE